MLVPLYLILAVALLFYLVIPIAGAIGAAAGWRRFRRRVVELKQAPELRYRELAALLDGAGGRRGFSYRLFGKIEAMEGDRRIWVRGERASALVDFSTAPLYVLGSGKAEAGSVRRLAWKSISSLTAGTSVFVGGRLAVEGGKPTFVDFPEERLLAVTYDGSDEDLVSRLVIGGRRLNEYWTSFGPLSLAVGMTVSSGLLLVLGSHSTFSTVRALCFLAAIIPVLPLLPPGLGLFLLYRWLWRKALRHRTRRDLLRLPSGAVEPSKDEEAGREHKKAELLMLLALGACGLAVLLNYVLAFLVWRSVV